MNGQLDLRTLQRWFSIVVEHLATADVAVRSSPARRLVPLRRLREGKVVALHPRMASTDQLQVYNGGYLARLVEVLQSDFGAVQHVLGEHPFRGLVARYLQRHPSRHPNLNQLGKHFPAFVQRQRTLPHRAFLADLARLEEALCQAFDAPEFTPVSLAELQQVAPVAWPKTRLQLNPSVRLIATRHPVGVWYQAWKDGKTTVVPKAETAWTLVFRRDDKVWRQRLQRPAFAVLEAFAAGRSLTAALAKAGDEPKIGEWFQEWARDGLFGGLRRPGRRASRS